jgi:four helix bundle protein
MIHKFRDLFVWQKSIAFVKEIYRITTKYPKSELFGLTSQIQRAAVSMPTNIAEGCGRNSNKELSRFIDIAIGSAFELETLLQISFELNYIEELEYNTLMKGLYEIQKMMYGLQQTLNKM